jgi:heme-degrading monooxygenase HmoA
MFVVIVNFPPIKEGKDSEFREWFTWTNKEFANCKGFVARRLLEPLQGGTYVAIVEHESRETFTAMGDTPAHAQAGKRAALLLDGQPTVHFYDVIG